MSVNIKVAENQWEKVAGNINNRIIARPWSSTDHYTYEIGEYCIHLGRLWKALEENTDTEPIEGLYWTSDVVIMNEVFQYVGNGKLLVADAITDKGVPTSATDTFQQMAVNISEIQGGGGNIEYVDLSGKLTIITDAYVDKSTGAEISYIGWSCSDFFDFSDYDYILFMNYFDYIESNKWNCAYNPSQAFHNNIELPAKSYGFWKINVDSNYPLMRFSFYGNQPSYSIIGHRKNALRGWENYSDTEEILIGDIDGEPLYRRKVSTIPTMRSWSVNIDLTDYGIKKIISYDGFVTFNDSLVFPAVYYLSNSYFGWYEIVYSNGVPVSIPYYFDYSQTATLFEVWIEYTKLSTSNE